MAEPTKTPSASEATRAAIILDPRVLIAGGAVAVIGLVILAFFLWMVPNAAERELKAACTGLRTTGPALCSDPSDPTGVKRRPCPLPMPAPDISAIDNNGQVVSLNQFRGKVVLVNFWASWCGVCKTEKPKLVEMAKKMAGDEFEVVTLASDRDWTDVLLALVESLRPGTQLPDGDVSMAQALEIYKQALPDGVPFKVFLDPPEQGSNIGQIASAWGIKAVPESALIDREGNVRAYFVNKRDWSKPVAQTCLRAVIDD